MWSWILSTRSRLAWQMEVLLGIQQLFTHSLEHKNWADETDSLTEKERAWTHHHRNLLIFLLERALRQQTKKIYHPPANNKESRLDLDLVHKQCRLTTHHFCATRDYFESDPGYGRDPCSQQLSMIFPSVSNELPFFLKLQTLTEKLKCCKEIF